MATGWRDTQSLVMLTGWDGAELEKLRLQDGTTYAQIVSETDAALGALNNELYNDPLWSMLVSYQAEPTVEYRVGASNGFEVHTEYGRPDPKRGATEGHMLPLVGYDRALGWTWDYLRKARLAQVRADIADGIKDARDKFRVAILTRLLDRDDDSGAAKGLGSSGYSPGFATTAGSTSVDFLPPSYGGTSFATTHEHYVAISGGVFTAAVFTDVKSELREHGHEPPYDVIIGPSDESTVVGLTGFVSTAQAGVQYASTVNLATALSPIADMNGSYYIGIISDCRVRVVRGCPQYYGFGWKSYGMNSQRNPLRVRVPEGQTRPLFTALQDPRAGNNAYPLNYLMLFSEFGVGVGDRTNGTPRYVNSSSWSDGTAT